MSVRLPPVLRLVALDEVDSTNDHARALAEQGAPDGTVVWARAQRRGRGRRGRQWTSPPGNLYCSALLRPGVAPAEAATFSYAAALAVAGALGNACPPLIEIGFKWPNDVLLNGRKVAGILLEAATSGDRVDWLIVGVGVNVAFAPEGTPTPATSLAAEGCTQATVESVLESYARHLMSWRVRWRSEGFAPLRAAWLRHARGLGEHVGVDLGNERIEGIFRDLDDDGALVLEGANGARRRIAAGDLYFGAAS